MLEAGFESARCWTGDLVARIGAEQVVALRTGIGSARRTYLSVPASARSSCLQAGQTRLHGLTPDDFVARGSIVHGIATGR
jgi:hypothetical protein